ncbi:gamma carbonic anhydrase family protein [Fusobacterium sp.]|uniref:gamma carbonic anhydrase family protein n=1 Tax=Fusobacterium sp. TaxID=68766 RepID=UPI002607CFDB|nr:gamma carbonic anhydrase family protein [Fusobacterium sp.]
MIYKLNGFEPKIGENNFIADTAALIGKVTTEKNVSIWFSAVMRADICSIYVGEKTSIQDNVTIHGDKGHDVIIGKNVTIGHNCIIHGCVIGDNCVIGMGTTILNGAVIPPNSLVGAHSLVTPSLKAEEGTLIIGSPAKSVKKLPKEQQEYLKNAADLYVEEIETYNNNLERVK